MLTLGEEKLDKRKERMILLNNEDSCDKYNNSSLE